MCACSISGRVPGLDILLFSVEGLLGISKRAGSEFDVRKVVVRRGGVTVALALPLARQLRISGGGPNAPTTLLHCSSHRDQQQGLSDGEQAVM